MCLFMRKIFNRCFFHCIHLLLIIITASLQYVFDFCHSDNREILREKEITCKEQTKRSHIESNFPNYRHVIRTPATRQIITIYRSNDDYKTFEPHTNIYQYRHKESNQQISSHFAEPENLWRQYVTSHHQPIAPTVW